MKSLNYLLVNRAALHHEHRVLQQGNVFERVAIHGDDVGKIALLQRANAVSPAKQISGIDGGGLDGLKRRHSNLYIHGEFMRVQAMRINRGIGAEGDFYARVKCVS